MTYVLHLYPDAPKRLMSWNGKRMSARTLSQTHPKMVEWIKSAKVGDVFMGAIGFWEAQAGGKTMPVDVLILSYYPSYTHN